MSARVAKSLVAGSSCSLYCASALSPSRCAAATPAKPAPPRAAPPRLPFNCALPHAAAARAQHVTPAKGAASHVTMGVLTPALGDDEIGDHLLLNKLPFSAHP